MTSNKLLPYGALVLGGFLGVVGAGFVTMYVFEAFIARIGDPDQSLLFWYLPLLLFGLLGIITGFKLGRWGNKRLHSTF